MSSERRTPGGSKHERSRIAAENRFAELLARQETGPAVDPETWIEEQEARLRPYLRILLEAHRRAEHELGALHGPAEPEPRPTAVPAKAAAGDVIDDYRLVRPIASGGMGEVWEAEQLSLHRRVALKLIRPDRVHPQALEFFAREARAGGRLHHPGIVAVHGYGRSSGRAWIAMELIEGGQTLFDLLERLKRAEVLPPDHDRTVAAILVELADALQAAHDSGVIHRDLKPRNVLLRRGDVPVVSDFGLARITDESAISLTGDVVGTYHYMSPEHVAARRAGIDHRADVFSLGVVMYELLTLQRPFQGDTTHQLASQILAKDPPDPRTIRSRIPAELVVICGKALEKDRDRRFQSMAELADDLRRYLANEPIRSRPPTRARRALQWTRRHPAKSVALALSTLSFALISTLLVLVANTRDALAAEVVSVKRLSALRELEHLVERADGLWPAHPAQIGAFEEWMLEAERLAGELESVGLPARPPERAAPGGEGPAPSEPALTDLAPLLDELHAEGAGLLTERGVCPTRGWSLPRRLALARRLAEGYGEGGEWRRRWSEVGAEIAADPLYGGLELPVQEGLVPIGRDPGNGFQEFWHVASGDEPARDAEGELVLGEDTGLVLVLLPGGRCWLGSQGSDPDAAQYDRLAGAGEGAPREVQLEPFLIATTELNQAQWLRLTGANPSFHQASELARTLLHPVEQVSWADCDRWLTRAGLELPSEDQWEYACRAGTRWPWWCGPEEASIAEQCAANLKDQAPRTALAPGSSSNLGVMIRAGSAHAPVASFAANPFGLHDVHGNVWEWCADRGPTGAGGETRVARGGGYGSRPENARASVRFLGAPSLSDKTLGVRPALSIRR